MEAAIKKVLSAGSLAGSSKNEGSRCFTQSSVGSEVLALQNFKPLAEFSTSYLASKTDEEREKILATATAAVNAHSEDSTKGKKGEEGAEAGKEGFLGSFERFKPYFENKIGCSAGLCKREIKIIEKNLNSAAKYYKRDFVLKRHIIIIGY